MMVLMKVELDVATSNQKAKGGTLGETIKSIVSQIKPEAAYFFASSGKRGGHLYVDLKDASQIPALVEPWFLAFNASVEIIPVMKPDDLAKAEPSIMEAAKRFG